MNMRKFLISLILLIPLFVFGQLRDSVLVKSPIFKVMYSETLQQPKWIEYHVACGEGDFSRKGLDFYVCDSVKTSDGGDYEGNVWDKGHLAPAADFNCNKDYLKMTFSYLNCVLQHEKLNRGAWRLLEAYERDLSKKYSVDVKIKMVYSKKSMVLKSGATVPDGFYKTIKYNKVVEVYYFKNEPPVTNEYKKYKIK
jgi:endonuclease G